MQKLSPWIRLEDCSVRTLLGADPQRIESRVALVEKTPRVRIRDAHFREDVGYYEDGGRYVEYRWDEHLDWATRGWKGEGPDDEEAKQWCDNMLAALGHWDHT